MFVSSPDRVERNTPGAINALQGWCPPLAALRRLGRRTSREIAEERFALQALRGDFAGDVRADPAALAAAALSH